jgi:ribokinase
MPRSRGPLQRIMYDVMVVGDTAWDIIVQTAEMPKFNRDIPAHIHQGPGGQGLNMALAARRESAVVCLVTQIGTDVISRQLARQIEQWGITGLFTYSDPLTQVVSFVRPDGERALITQSGRGPDVDPGNVPPARLLLLSGYLWARPGGPERVLRWLDWARRHRMIILLDPAHADLAREVRGLLERVDWVLPNHDEWEALGQPLTPNVLLKLGPQGARLWDRYHWLDIEVTPVSRVVDTTGAGDAVAGSFAAGLARGLSPETAARRAIESGRRVVSRLGAI